MIVIQSVTKWSEESKKRYRTTVIKSEYPQLCLNNLPEKGSPFIPQFHFVPTPKTKQNPSKNSPFIA